MEVKPTWLRNSKQIPSSSTALLRLVLVFRPLIQRENSTESRRPFPAAALVLGNRRHAFARYHDYQTAGRITATHIFLPTSAVYEGNGALFYRAFSPEKNSLKSEQIN